MAAWLSDHFMRRLTPALSFILVTISLYVVYSLYGIVRNAYHIRKKYNDIPSLPRHPLWGNLVNCGAKLRGERHPDYGFEEIWESLGRPPAFLVDLAPVSRAVLIIAEPQIAEAIVQPSDEFKYSTPKSDTFSAISRLIGAESLLTKEGEDWKNLRKRFNPGFQPKYLYSLTPSVVAQTLTFIERLEKAADEGCVITLADYAKDLTTDIITQLTIEKDLHAQSTLEGEGEKSMFGILRASRRLSELVYKTGEGISLLHVLDLRRPIKAMFYE
jgi:Cytochrome P450